MGKVLTVKTGYTAVLLPDKAGSGGLRNYKAGDQVTVTNAELAALPTSTLNAVTQGATVPDPFRKSKDPLAVFEVSNTAVTGAQTAANVGWNVWTLTGNITLTGLVVAPTNNTTGVFGPSPGSASNVAFMFIQDATGSRTIGAFPAAWKWAGGAAPTWSTTAGYVDVVKFVTVDGGTTFYETDRSIGIH